MSPRRLLLSALAATAAMALVSYWRVTRRSQPRRHFPLPPRPSASARRVASNPRGTPLQPWRVVDGRPLSVPDAFWDAGVTLDDARLEPSETNGAAKAHSNGLRPPRNGDATG